MGKKPQRNPEPASILGLAAVGVGALALWKWLQGRLPGAEPPIVPQPGPTGTPRATILELTQR